MPHRASLRSPLVLLGALIVPAALAAACSSKGGNGPGGATAGRGASGRGGSGTNSSGPGTSGQGGGISITDGGLPDATGCAYNCSPDHHSVIDCTGATVATCSGSQACDLSTGGCSDACTAAVNNKQSIGCDYYATNMEMDYSNQCFAAYVANTWSSAAHLGVEFYPGTPLTVASFARIPSGTGANITFTAYDDTTGLMPGDVAILFLSGSSTSPNVPCPAGVSTAIPMGSLIQGTGQGHSFHITSDVPVVAYQMNPYGGGSAFITGASLLLPTSVWDTNYVAVTAAPYSSVTMDSPSLNIIAAQDGTTVTLLPSVAVVGSAGGKPLPAGPANMPYTFTLDTGEQAQFSQQADLTGTIVQATHPIGFMAGNACMQKPLGTGDCDHGEQMLPPIKALGNEYAAVMFRPRVAGDMAIWHLVGTVAGTTLTYSPAAPTNAPTMLAAGQAVDFMTDQPFVVTSQDLSHPFRLFAEMTGALWSGLSNTGGYGDPDFVLGVPPQQFLNDYVFFTDPSYPETNLVVVRAKDKSGAFQDVSLDCAGTLGGWQAVGDYEWTRIDLMSHDFVGQNGCSTGRHEIKSTALFGLWVWGWGSPETTINTKYVSYGYPGGMNVAPVNGVTILPVSK
jgi:hypothetical protein